MGRPERPPRTRSYDFPEERPSTQPNTSPPPPQQQQRQIVIIVDPQEIDDDDEVVQNIRFHDRKRRKRFIKNVLLAVAFQFAIVAICIVVSKLIPQIETEFFRTPEGIALTWLSMIVWFILLIAIGCCSLGRGKPNCCNVSLLLISTVLASVFTVAVTIRYELFAILFSAAVTAGVVIILALITLCTKLDITDKMMYVLGAVLALMLFSMIASICFATGTYDWNTRNQIELAITACVCLLYVVLILCQMQLIVGGRKAQYEEDDWLVASIMLFFDILMFFLIFLGIGSRS